LPDEKSLFAGIVVITVFLSGMRLTRNDHSAEAVKKLEICELIRLEKQLKTLTGFRPLWEFNKYRTKSLSLTKNRLKAMVMLLDNPQF